MGGHAVSRMGAASGRSARHGDVPRHPTVAATRAGRPGQSARVRGTGGRARARGLGGGWVHGHGFTHSGGRDLVEPGVGGEELVQGEQVVAGQGCARFGDARGAAAGLRGWRRRAGWRRRSPGSAEPASRGVRCSGRRSCRRSRRQCRPCHRCRRRSRRPRRCRGTRSVPGPSSTTTETSSASTGTVLVRPHTWQVMETNVAVVMAGSFRLASPSAGALSRACRCVPRYAPPRTASGQRPSARSGDRPTCRRAGDGPRDVRPGRCAGATLPRPAAVSSYPASPAAARRSPPCSPSSHRHRHRFRRRRRPPRDRGPQRPVADRAPFAQPRARVAVRRPVPRRLT